MASNTYNVVIFALRFFYCITLRRPQMKLELLKTKVTYKLPQILSVDEVQKIINSTGNIKHKTLLMVTYGAGLRASEVVNLRIEDIDSDRMTLHIRNGKNRKDRYVILSPVVLAQLRTYWKYCKFTDYIFPGETSSGCMTRHTPNLIYKRVKARAGIKKIGGIHTLRHAFATHMLESGVDLFIIKELLGHTSIRYTVRYLRFVPCRDQNVKSPIDQLSI